MVCVGAPNACPSVATISLRTFGQWVAYSTKYGRIVIIKVCCLSVESRIGILVDGGSAAAVFRLENEPRRPAA